MMAKTGSIEGDRLDVLVTLVEDYERKHYPIKAIKFAMEQRSLTVKDLVPMIGKTNRVYEILNRKRQLTLHWGNHFWARGYCVDTVGLDEEHIRKYVNYQEKEERRQ